MDDVTWTCHVCGKVRPDARISVYSKIVNFNEVEITENVRYCNDNPSCIEGAKNVDFLAGGKS